MPNFKGIGPAVCSGEYPGMKNGGASYNVSQPVHINVLLSFPGFSTMINQVLRNLKREKKIVYKGPSVLSLVSVTAVQSLRLLHYVQVDSYYKMRRRFSYPGIRQIKLLGRFP